MRSSPMFAATGKEPMARLEDICHLMQNGDGLWFAGRSLHSWIIRIGTVSNVSHACLLKRAVGSSINDPHALRILDMVGGTGCRDASLLADVVTFPGQYYWAPVNRDRFPEFDGDGAVAEAEKEVKKGTPYGMRSVLTEAMFHYPFIRVAAYWWNHHRFENEGAWTERHPYCSMGQSQWWTRGGNVDPVPGLVPQLTSPADTYRSWICSSAKVALYP